MHFLQALNFYKVREPDIAENNMPPIRFSEIVVGMLTDSSGRPLAVRVFEGYTIDDSIVLEPQLRLKKVSKKRLNTHINHRVCDFSESGDICSVYIIPRSAVLFRGFKTCLMNILHNLLKLTVNLF